MTLGKFGRYLFAVILAGHGLVHVMGFAATWQIAKLSAISSTPSGTPLNTGVFTGGLIAMVAIVALGFVPAALLLQHRVVAG